MTELDAFYEALSEAVARAGNPNKFARYTGIPVQTLNRWFKRESQPNLEGVIALLPFINWPPNRERHAVMKGAYANSKQEPVVGDDLKRIPVVMEAGAGTPVDFFATEPDKYIDILPRYYKENVRAVEIVGDSMEPTISKGAIVGVRPFEGNLREGGIYLCHLQYFGNLVKRVKISGTNGLLLISDNKEYDPITIPFSESEGLIIGEIVWCWQLL